MNSFFKIGFLFIVLVFSFLQMRAEKEEQSRIDVLSFEVMDNFMAGNYESAIPKIIMIIDYLQNNHPDEILTLVNWQKSLGMSYLNIGDYNNAEKVYISSLGTLESNNFQKEPAFRMVLDALSVLYVQLQNYDKANIYNGKAKILYEEALDFGDDYVRCLNNSALIQNGLGYNTIAKMQLDVALRQAEENLNKKSSLDDFNKLIPQSSDKEIDQTLLNENYYVQTKIRPYLTLLSNSAVIYSDLGYFADAVKTAKKSIQISEQYGLKEPLPYNNLGGIYLYKSKFPQAAKLYLKGYDNCVTPYENDEIGFNAALGLFLAKDNRAAQISSEVSSKMRENIRKMFAFLSGEERANYWKHFENYLPVLNMIIYEKNDSKYFGSIYDNILEAKGLLLRSTNAVRDAVLLSGTDTDKEDYFNILNLKKLLQKETNDSLRVFYSNQIEDLDKKLTRNVSSYADFIKSQNITWEDIRNNLNSDEIAIEFYNIPLVWSLDSIQNLDSEPRYCAIILRNSFENPQIIPLFKESELEGLEQEDLLATDLLYNLIWKPLEEELKEVKTIYFAADRELHKIGIEYSPTENGHTIGDKFNILRLSSTRLLAEIPKENKTENAVLYGGLRYNIGKDDLIEESRSGEYHPSKASRAFNNENLRYGVKYLPGTLEEVTEIAQNFSIEPRLITDIRGTEESFKSLVGTPVDIIHLATHGFFWSNEDAQNRSYVSFLKNDKSEYSQEDNALLRSGLFFSGANMALMGEELPEDVEDGVLTALELSNMNLGNVDMVVMSACESGLGETSGEGVFGLQRGFKLAGANTLLMSLWKVDDTATQLLMTEFYKNYIGGKSKKESLRIAQNSLRNNSKYADPEYWAAFILLDALN